jgi:hypothetical protein
MVLWHAINQVENDVDHAHLLQGMFDVDVQR